MSIFIICLLIVCLVFLFVVNGDSTKWRGVKSSKEDEVHFNTFDGEDPDLFDGAYDQFLNGLTEMDEEIDTIKHQEKEIEILKEHNKEMLALIKWCFYDLETEGKENIEIHTDVWVAVKAKKIIEKVDNFNSE